MNTKHQVGTRAARQLRTTERKIDEAIAEAMMLGHQMVLGRTEAGFAAAVGQDALTSLIGGLELLSHARGAVIKTHDRLLDVAEEQGVRWRMDGPTESKPDDRIRKPTAVLPDVVTLSVAA